jgi:hypothetical protein
MSQEEITDTFGHQEVSETSIGNLSKLAGLARQAYEQKRTKECLDLTRAILLIDPDNADAQWMRASVQSQIHQDLENARAFLVQAQSKDSSEPEVVPTPAPPETPVVAEREDAAAEAEREPLRLVPAAARTRTTIPQGLWILGALVVFSLLLGGAIRVVVKTARARSAQKVAAAESSKPIAPAIMPDPVAVAPTPYTEDPVPVAGPLPRAAVPPAPQQHVEADNSVGLSASDLRLSPSAKPDVPLVSTAKGTLAVSSATSVDIYEGDQYLGSSPVSLPLSAGMHTLEYRHGDLRRTVTQAIYANETARAMIAFDVTVQINSKPWAEVFLDGAEQKDLGQTPLSGVRVPIGSVLIFQNPKFQPKRYRVTGTETGIQIVFP